MPGDPTHPAQHVLGFERLTGMTPEQLEELAETLAGGPALLTPGQLVDVVRPFVGDDAPAVADALLGVAYVARETAQSDPVALVGQYLRDAGWDDTRLIAFARVSQAVATIAQLRAVQALSKSIDLGFAHSLLFASAQVITDSRPVYSPDRDAVDGAIISQTLRLQYRRNGELENIDIALDQLDLITLRDQCDIALKKAATLQAYFAAPTPVPTAIVGES